MTDTPYVGLRPFNRDETDIFFGRETYTDELLELLGEQKFIAVVGDSGCGKSSLVRTGLEAGLQAGLLSQAGTQWRIAEMRPSFSPFANLVDALLEPDALGADYEKYFTDSETARSHLLECVTQGSLSLHQLLQAHPLPNQHKLLLVCDQFEEIFRYEDNTEAAALVNLLLASSQAHPFGEGLLSDSIYVVITMRSEYLGKCALFSGLAQAVNQGIYLTPRLTRLQLREAIEEPVFVCEGSIEPALVERLLEDAKNNPDQLPLLQHVLMRMWELARLNDASDLTLALYEDSKIEGLKQALSIHADEIYKALTKEQQRISEILFRNLAVIEHRGDVQNVDLRNPVKLTRIAKLAKVSWQEIIPIIDAFRQPMRNFLTPVLPMLLTSNSVIDISHESFIRHWKQLQNWLRDESKSASYYRRLRDRALLHQKSRAGYLVEPELSIYWNWFKEKKPTALWAKRHLGDFEITQTFLLKSRRRHFWRRFGIVGSIILIIAGSIGSYQYQVEQTKKIELSNKNLQQVKDKIEIAKNNIEQQKNKTKQSLNMLYKVRDVFFTEENSPKLEKIFAELVEDDPKNGDAWIYYGDALKNQNKLNKAEKAYRQAIIINPKNNWAWFSLGSVLTKENKFNEAIKIYQQQIKVSPTNFSAWNNLGNVLVQENKVDEAIKISQKAVEINPENWILWHNLGGILIRENKFEQALAIFNTVLNKYKYSNLFIISSSVEIDTIEDDMTHFKEHLKNLKSLLKINKQYYAVISFSAFITEPKKGWAIVTAIEATLKEVKFTWNFKTLEPTTQYQDKKTQQQIRLFIDYFNAKIDLATLKQQLKASEQTP